MSKKRAVVIGYGGMGKWHTDEMLKSDVIELAGIYDIDPARVALAESNGIRAYATPEEIWADPTVDMVTIAVPNDFHEPYAVQALAAGKHVVCEKPVTLNSESLQTMIDAAVKADRLFTVHQNRRWDGEFLVMRDIYRSGDLGDIFHIESRVHGSRGIPGDWRQLPEKGGGMILDWGIHLIDQMMGIVTDRKLTRIYCKCDHITNELVDDGFKLEMYFEGDVSAHIEVGTSNFINLPRFYMVGRNGSALIPDWGNDAQIVWCTNYNEKEVVPVITAAGITKTMAPRDEKSIAQKFNPQPVADVHDFYRNFVRAMNGEETQIVTHHQMMVDMKIMEAAFESDRTGMPVDVDLRF